MKSSWLILAGVAGVAYWLYRSGSSAKPASPVSIESLSTNLGSGNTAEQEVTLFDQLFGIKDASREFAKFKAGAASLRYRICHSDGTCEVDNGGTIGNVVVSPLRGPKYFLDYLGIN
ncbi:MAG: hypothetical protein E6Q97_28905 [Desulfurellales bacterium]|nr:MAG: hypothetical protein E6Q97_28905 [Desulfurellales bacterium]